MRLILVLCVLIVGCIGIRRSVRMLSWLCRLVLISVRVVVVVL